jgi:adenylate kinase
MILFVGVAGSGKSVQGRMLADEFGLPWLSTGEFLRMLISGDKRKQMVAGKLLGDQEIIALVQKVFSVVDVSHEFVLDGFPRTAAQADWLLNQVKHGQLELTAIVHIIATREVVKSRLLSRARQDDTSAAIEARFKEYEEVTLPIVDLFKQAGSPVIDIQGEQAVQAVHAAIVSALKNKLQ